MVETLWYLSCQVLIQLEEVRPHLDREPCFRAHHNSGDKGMRLKHQFLSLSKNNLQFLHTLLHQLLRLYNAAALAYLTHMNHP